MECFLNIRYLGSSYLSQPVIILQSRMLNMIQAKGAL